MSSAFPNGISSGDVTQNSAVLWTRGVEIGSLSFQISTDPQFKKAVKTTHLVVIDPMTPVKIEIDHLKPGQQYYYRAIDASGDIIEGTFQTAAELGTYDGFHFGVLADQFGELAPFSSIKNAPSAGLDLVVKLGDTIYADLAYQGGTFVPTSTTTLAQFQAKHDDVYNTHLGANYWAELQAATSILSIIDDHEVIDDFAGGAPPGSDPRFASQAGDFINETALFNTGLTAFNQYNAIEDRVYQNTGSDLFDGAPDLYRYNTYGSDAAIMLLDARTFRDTEVPAPVNPLSPTQIGQFLVASFDPDRTMLGDIQLDRLKQDLLDARDNGVTWKFVMLPEPIQNFGPIIGPGDRYEGYAAERNELLKFIEDNHIENVVFVSSDTHWTSVNNLTYQTSLGGAHIQSSAFEVNTLAVASIPIAERVAEAALAFGLIDQFTFDFYKNVLPNAPDISDVTPPSDPFFPFPNDKDDFVEQLLSGYMTSLGYDPIGLEGSNIQATLLAGDYFVGHSFGWTEFEIAQTTTQELLVTTWGIPVYSDLNIPDPVTTNPDIVSQFEVTPTFDSIMGSSGADRLTGTNAADVIIGAAGNDVLNGLSENDYVDGGKGNDRVSGDSGDDQLFGRDGNDRLNGGDGADQVDGGTGNDQLTGGSGNDTFIFGADFGIDTITDFSYGLGLGDIIQFDQATFADFNAVLLATTDIGADLEISASATDHVILQNVASVASLAADDFQFI